jgi:hypothetical protein
MLTGSIAIGYKLQKTRVLNDLIQISTGLTVGRTTVHSTGFVREFWDLPLFREGGCPVAGGIACVADEFGSATVREVARLGEAGGFGDAP